MNLRHVPHGISRIATSCCSWWMVDGGGGGSVSSVVFCCRWFFLHLLLLQFLLSRVFCPPPFGFDRFNCSAATAKAGMLLGVCQTTTGSMHDPVMRPAKSSLHKSKSASSALFLQNCDNANDGALASSVCMSMHCCLSLLLFLARLHCQLSVGGAHNCSC